MGLWAVEEFISNILGVTWQVHIQAFLLSMQHQVMVMDDWGKNLTDILKETRYSQFSE